MALINFFSLQNFGFCSIIEHDLKGVKISFEKDFFTNITRANKKANCQR